MLGRWRRKGQSTTEYILIVVLVAILSIGIITTFSKQVRDLWKAATGRLAGSTETEQTTISDKYATEAVGRVDKSMADMREAPDD